MIPHEVVQIAGDTFNKVKVYIGPPRELIVDESNWDLLIQDGSTPGGRRLLNISNADSRYQARSPELDGLLGFEPQERGFLTRLGPADYRLRRLTVDTNELTLTNANGYDGNPLLGIADSIVGDREFVGDVTVDGDVGVTGEVEALGGFIGNLLGDTTGTHYGDVEGNLTGNANGNHTGTFTGDVDVSSHNITFGAKQVPLAALADDVIAYIAERMVQPGTIRMWSGSIASIPSGYFLCDGQNGTPNLTDKFVVGAGGSMVPHDTGGTLTHVHAAATATGGAHLHTGEIGATSLTIEQIPNHRHGNGVVDKNDKLYNHGGLPAVPTMGDSIDGNSSNGTREGWTTSVGDGQPHTHTMSMESSGAHAHGVTVEAGANVPPFYALAYIMKGPY